MYGLPPGMDLEFFQRKTLQQVCIGANEVIFKFDEALSVTVMSPIACTVAGFESHRYEDYRSAAGALAAFLQDIVVAAKGHSDGTLSLEFHGGGRLDIYDDSKEYESYVIKCGEKTVVV